MVDRPPVTLKAALPQGTLNGLGALLPAALADDFDRGYIVAEVTCPKTEHDKETGVDAAVLRLTAVEVLPGGKVSDAAATGAELIHALRSERIGDNPIDFGSASDQDYAKLADLRRALHEYQAVQGMSDVTLGEDVIATVPGAGAGWNESSQIIEEYLRTKGAMADPVVGDDAGERKHEPEPDEA